MDEQFDVTGRYLLNLNYIALHPVDTHLTKSRLQLKHEYLWTRIIILLFYLQSKIDIVTDSKISGPVQEICRCSVGFRKLKLNKRITTERWVEKLNNIYYEREFVYCYTE